MKSLIVFISFIIPLSDCHSSLCSSHGNCIHSSSSSFFCQCHSGYFGPYCQYSKCSNECNGGQCLHDSISNSFNCQCLPGWKGDDCLEEKITVCNRRRPCGQHGICIPMDEDDFICQCDKGWNGRDCRVKEEICHSLCYNGGTCIAQRGVKYTCRCPEGYEGDKCQWKTNQCTTTLCNGGECVDTDNGPVCSCDNLHNGYRCEISMDTLPSNGCSPDVTSTRACWNGGYCNGDGICSCPSGWNGILCNEDVDECKWDPCHNGGSCINNQGSFQCICNDSFGGDICHIKMNGCSSNKCSPDSECIPLGDSYTCKCMDGWTGQFCENSQCGSGCIHGFCYVNEEGKGKCDCESGWEGDYCERDMDECATQPCVQGSSCINKEGTFECLCVHGMTGTFCEIRMDECPRDSSDCCGCENGGNCLEGQCICPFGYEGIHCETEIRHLCHDSSCPIGQLCTRDHSAPREIICRCPEGTYGIGCLQKRKDSKGCASNPCQHDGRCIQSNGENTYACLCTNAYEGMHCEIAIDHCSSNPCKNQGVCLNELDGFVCHCALSHYGKRCEHTRDPCSGNLCDNGSKCRPTTDMRNYTCECGRGFMGQLCEEDIDECQSSPCLNGGTCSNSHGSYRCVCPFGWEGRHCMKNTDECSTDPCLNGGTCIDGIADFTCACRKGFSGKLCAVNIDDCAFSPCQNGGKCKDGMNEYTCQCPRGFSGYECQVNEDDCRPGVCLNGGICRDGVAEYQCQCSRGYTGKNCQEWVNVDMYNTTDEMDRQLCKRNECDRLAGDGHCDKECNHYACAYDGGDCSAKKKDPWDKCANPSYCSHKYMDGNCDEICNNEDCLFDANDCRKPMKKCPVTREKYCRKHYSNGICDDQCNNEECLNDGGDCDGGNRNSTLSYDLTFVLTMDHHEFIEKMQEFLVLLSQLIHATVRVKNGIDGPEVYEWKDGDIGKKIINEDTILQSEYNPSRIRRSSQSLNVILFLEVDVSNCHHDCFSSAEYIVSFIGASESKQPLALGMKIRDVYSGGKDRPPEGGYVWLIVAGFLGAGVIFVAFVMTRPGQKRKMVKLIEAPTWYPSPKDSVRDNNYNPFGYSQGYPYPPYQQQVSTLHPSGYKNPPVYKKMKERDVIPEPSELEKAVTEGLLDKIDPCEVNHHGRFKRTPLHWLALRNGNTPSSDIEDLQKLYDNKAHLEAEDEDGDTVLHLACRNHKHFMVKKLLQLGANPLHKNKRERTPLHDAASHFDDKCIEYIVEKMKEDKKECKDNLNIVDDGDCTALMLYAMYSEESTKGAEILIDAGADVNYQGNKECLTRYKGRSALHYAAHRNTGKKEMIELLIGRNANKDAQDVEDYTPLLLAVVANNESAVKTLLERGANPDYANQNDKTAEVLAKERKYDNVLTCIQKYSRTSAMTYNNIGLPSIGGVTLYSTQIPPKTHPQRIKKIPLKKSKSPDTPPTSSSGYSTTPSPAGLKGCNGNTSSGMTFIDSPDSSNGQYRGNDYTFPNYPSAYSNTAMAWDGRYIMSSLQANPSPPYEGGDNTYYHQYYPPSCQYADTKTHQNM